MTQFRTRPCRIDDAPAIAGLIPGFAAAEFEDLLRDEIQDLAADTRAVLDPADRLVGVAFVPPPPPGGYRLELVGKVHPQCRGLGLGRELLSWQLRRAADLHAATAPDTEWHGQTLTALEDTAAIRLYERLGLTPVRYFVEMKAPAAATPAAAIPGVRIEPFEQSQAPQVYAVHADAFRGLWGHQERSFDTWAAHTVLSAAFRADLARVALVGDTIVGFVLPYDRGTLYMGQVATASSWRSRGVATALLSAVLSAGGAAGFTESALDADADNPGGAAAVYARSGYRVTQRLVMYRKTV
jgi:mycothiol synthase